MFLTFVNFCEVLWCPRLPICCNPSTAYIIVAFQLVWMTIRSTYYFVTVITWTSTRLIERWLIQVMGSHFWRVRVPASALCVKFACSPCIVFFSLGFNYPGGGHWVSSRCFGFALRSTHMLRWIWVGKLPVGVNVWVLSDGLVAWPGLGCSLPCTLIFWVWEWMSKQRCRHVVSATVRRQLLDVVECGSCTCRPPSYSGGWGLCLPLPRQSLIGGLATAKGGAKPTTQQHQSPCWREMICWDVKEFCIWLQRVLSPLDVFGLRPEGLLCLKGWRAASSGGQLCLKCCFVWRASSSSS